jgi:type IV pilus assembly protein PilF
MPPRFSIVVLLLMTAGTSQAAEDVPRRDPDLARQQVEFGIEMAHRGLWNEAAYRFERATELDPEYAEAYNDLGIAYEQLGRLPQARRMYERALRLEPDNPHIRTNYELFMAIDDRRVKPSQTAGPPGAGRPGN